MRELLLRRHNMMATNQKQIKPIQIIRNGDFSSGINDWKAYSTVNGNISSQNNILTYTVLNPVTNVYGNKISNTNITNIGGIKNGRTYYCSAYINVPTNCNISFFYQAGSRETMSAVAGWNRYERIYTYSRDASINLMGVDSMIDFNIGDIVLFKNIFMIDLTSTFGAGNEPDLATCKALFHEDYYEYYIPDGYNQ